MNSKSIAILAASIVAASVGIFLIYNAMGGADIQPPITKTEPDEVQTIKRGNAVDIKFRYNNTGTGPINSMHISIYVPSELTMIGYKITDAVPINNATTSGSPVRPDYTIKYKEGFSIKELRGNNLGGVSFAAKADTYVHYDLTALTSINPDERSNIRFSFKSGILTKEVNDVYITVNENNYLYRIIVE